MISVPQGSKARAGRAAVYLVLIAPMLIRLVALERSATNTELAAHLHLIGWELPMVVALCCIYEFSRRLESPIVRLPIRLAAGFAWSALMADALIFYVFGMRLALPDIIRYGAGMGEIAAYLGTPLVAATALGAAFLVLINVRSSVANQTSEAHNDNAWAGRRPVPRAFLLVAALMAVLIGSTGAPRDDGDLYAWRTQNWVSLNTQNSLYRSYHPAFLDSVRSALPGLTCGVEVRSNAIAPNILIVLLESFSSGLTPMYGGRRAAYPQLERISREGLRFTRFLANGFTTEHGLIAILGGRMPVFPTQVRPFSLTGNTAFAGHYGLTTSLPACADFLGYHTEFLTAGDLSFTNKGTWLQSIGFARVEGHDTPLYDGLPRGIFHSVSDSALYARAMKRLGELQAGTQPFLLVLEGVGSHGPYGGNEGMIAAMRSADESLGWLYDELFGSGFLKSGLALFVSDHRVLTAVTADERVSFGSEAPARVPAVLLGHGIGTGVDETARHQLDVMPTVLGYMGARNEPATLAAPLTDTPGTRCIPWLHHGRRDEISASCDGGYVRIRLDAERTRVVEGASTQWTDELISALHAARIDGSGPARQAKGYREDPAGAP
jgi:lipoteichoic acid synthase